MTDSANRSVAYAALCRSWKRLIADILRQVDRANRLCQETRNLRKFIAGRTVKAATAEQGGILVVLFDLSRMKFQPSFASVSQRRSTISSRFLAVSKESSPPGIGNENPPVCL